MRHRLIVVGVGTANVGADEHPGFNRYRLLSNKCEGMKADEKGEHTLIHWTGYGCLWIFLRFINELACSSLNNKA
jgi:hypothetical protein